MQLVTDYLYFRNVKVLLTRAYSLSPWEIPWAPLSGFPSDLGYISLYIPPLITIQIQYCVYYMMAGTQFAGLKNIVEAGDGLLICVVKVLNITLFIIFQTQQWVAIFAARGRCCAFVLLPVLLGWRLFAIQLFQYHPNRHVCRSLSNNCNFCVKWFLLNCRLNYIK